jgi:hypothetical protein
MPVNLAIQNTVESDQSAENSTLKKVETQIGQLEDLITKRRKIRSRAIKVLRQIFQNDPNRRQVFGDHFHKAHRYFAENPWIKDTYLGSDSILLRMLREVQKNYSS